jgi:type I restriction enzyme S subunit
VIDGNHAKFFFYLCTTINFELYKYGSAIPSMTQGTLNDIVFCSPLFEEQTAIANYLDQKTAQIDELIAKKERLIQLLEEERTALINQAVTKGLDPTVPMKDSCIEWLGAIPAHWEVKRLKQIFNFNKGLTITKENLEDTGIPCVNYGEIHSKFGFELDLVQHQLKCVNENYLQSDTKAIIRKGDFVFADTSEDVDGSGNFTYLKSDDEIFAGYHTIVARTNYEIESRYFAYQFDSIPFRTQIRQSVKGIKVFSITQGILKNVQTWMPPLEDQILIVNFLDKKVHAIQNLTQTLKSEIKLMLEYKTALISEVVTGKVDVRNEKLS